jgi:hypothetical protein
MAGSKSASGTGSKSDSNAPQVAATDALWKGLLTGYSYNAIRDLYFKNGGPSSLEVDKRADLLRWLYTYQSLVNDWKVNDEQKDLVQSMIDVVEGIDIPGASTRASSTNVTLERFQALFYALEGIARAEAQSSSYAMTFYVHVNELAHPDVNQSKSGIFRDLRNSLSDLKNFVPNSAAYSVVRHDIDKIESDVQIEDYYKKDLRRTEDWSALILGIRSVSDILTRRGKIAFHILFAVLAILFLMAAFSIVGGILFGIIYALIYVFKINLSTLTLSNGKDLISTLSTVISILTAVGLSLSAIVQKAWSSLKSLDSWLTVQTANQTSFRNSCQGPADQSIVDPVLAPKMKK